MTAIGTLIVDDLIAECLQIKTGGSIHGVEYSQTVDNAKAIDDEDILADAEGLFIANAPTTFPCVLIGDSGEETIERRGPTIHAERLFRMIGILRNATQPQIQSFEEDLKYVIEYLRNRQSQKTTGHFIFNHQVLSVQLAQAQLTRSDREHVQDIARLRNKDYRIVDMTISVTVHYDPLQLRN